MTGKAWGSFSGDMGRADLDLVHWLVFYRARKQASETMWFDQSLTGECFTAGDQCRQLSVSSSSQPASLMKQNDERSIIGGPWMTGVLVWNCPTLEQEGEGLC